VRRAIFVIALLGTTAAHADVANRNLLPMGEREAFLANTGNTSVSPGASFYNPAGLALLEHSSIALSGTTFLRFEIETDAFLVVDGEDQPFEASGFLPIPASLISTYRAGAWTLATSVIVPDVIAFANRQTFVTDTTSVTILQNNARNDLWLGGSLARRIGDRIAVGVSLFGIYRTSANFVFFQVVRPEGVTQVTADSSTSVLGVSAIGGVRVELTDRLALGARIQSPMVQVLASGEVYQSVLSTGEMGGLTEATAELEDVQDPLPTDVGLGLSFRPFAALELMADVNVQLATPYAEYAENEVTGASRVDVHPAWRASVAGELAIGDKSVVQLGAMWNTSAIRNTVDGGTREDYAGVTGGLVRRSGRTRTGLGAFVLRSFGKSRPLFDPAREVDAHTTGYGVLLTTAYQL
jgi:hypothetical protein